MSQQSFVQRSVNLQLRKGNLYLSGSSGDEGDISWPTDPRAIREEKEIKEDVSGHVPGTMTSNLVQMPIEATKSEGNSESLTESSRWEELSRRIRKKWILGWGRDD